MDSHRSVMDSHRSLEPIAEDEDSDVGVLPVPLSKIESLNEDFEYKFVGNGILRQRSVSHKTSVRFDESMRTFVDNPSKSSPLASDSPQGSFAQKPPPRLMAKQRSSTRFSVNNRNGNLADGNVKKPSFTQSNDFSESPYEQVDASSLRAKLQTQKSKSSVRLLGLKSASMMLYVDLERGESFLSPDKFLDRKRFRQKTPSGKLVMDGTDIEKGAMMEDTQPIEFASFVADNEIDFFGMLWRQCFKFVLEMSHDKINALRLSRILQFFLITQCGYEAYLIERLVVNMDKFDKPTLDMALNQVFKNRNVSRIILRTSRITWDYFYHTATLIRYGKYFDAFQQLFFFTGYGFPASENFVNTRDLTVSIFFSLVFGEGSFITRFISGRQALQTYDPDVTAQNLAAELSGFETANRNQYGTQIGRMRTKAFRRQHRLPVDESLMRSFQSNPVGVLVNNGAEHTLRQVSRHWANMLFQPDGNFAHQRMEQLNPFQFLRFQFTSMLVALSVLRGICAWDADHLAPMITRLQSICSEPTMIENVKGILHDFRENILVGVCGGIASRVDAMTSLIDSLDQCVDDVSREAGEIKELCDAYCVGTIMISARKVLNSLNWVTPSDNVLRQAVFDIITGDKLPTGVSHLAVRRALNLLSPMDKRTLIELVNKGFSDCQPGRLLLRRTMTLLQRELRRDELDSKLIEISKGKEIEFGVCAPKSVYWLVDSDGRADVFIFEGHDRASKCYRFRRRTTDNTNDNDLRLVHSDERVKVLVYIEAAEQITIAQWVFMKIELDYGKKFTYNAFMEFPFLREHMLDMTVVAQWFSYVLDDARLNRLQSFQRGNLTEVPIDKIVAGTTYFYYQNKQYEPITFTSDYKEDDPQFDVVKSRRIVSVPPQSMIVIGGGPTGLLTSIHCLQNVLISGGTMRLLESRDSFTQGGAAYERSQIVRLDSRWIAMLRYHLGTVYEDVFVPAVGETDPHYGNSLPFQGFIEITIKDMENMIHIQVAKAASRGLLVHVTNSLAQYDYVERKVYKLGKNLALDDLILWKVDTNGMASESEFSWRVVDFVTQKTLGWKDLALGEVYAIFITALGRVASYRLLEISFVSNELVFQCVDQSGEGNLVVKKDDLPAIYPKGTKIHHQQRDSVVLESVLPGDSHTNGRLTLKYSEYENHSFHLDIGNTHVCSATGKAHDSPHHLEVTTEEPHGVCCLSGMKVSWGMHNFGTRRWQNGLVDDVRSTTDQNTRVVGDFTKIVNTRKIAQRLVDNVKNDPNWKLHFMTVFDDMKFDAGYDFYELLVTLIVLYRKSAPYTRSHVQTRFFEVGDIFYLGMEFPREFARWKIGAIETMVNYVLKDRHSDKEYDKKQSQILSGKIGRYIDRLWYDATLETIRTGDVYNPGGQDKIHRLYTIDSYIDVALHTLDVGECFRLSDCMKGIRHEVLSKSFFGGVVVRTYEGVVSKMKSSTLVKLCGNLTRAPDGLHESKVSIATFDVAHTVNHHCIQVNDNAKGYVFAPLGDEQSSPHFMRYSGLTGAAINAMFFDNFIFAAIEQVPLFERMKTYCSSTDWSNGEVVQRGTTNNYGEDGFLRPGFPYIEGVRYMKAKVLEHIACGCRGDMMSMMSRDWKIKMAAAMIPRQLEYNDTFLSALINKFEEIVFTEFIKDLESNKTMDLKQVAASLKKIRLSFLSDGSGAEKDFSSRLVFWKNLIGALSSTPDIKMHLLENEVFVARHVELMLLQVIEQAQALKDNNARVSTQADHQPPSVDAFIVDFATEVQATANFLTQSSTVAAIALAVSFRDPRIGALFSAFFTWLALGTVTNTNRYKNRNEEWRIDFYDMKYIEALKAVYSCINIGDHKKIPLKQNPFYIELEKKKDIFVKNAKYYDYPYPTEFLKIYDKLTSDFLNPENINTFMDKLMVDMIVDIYHVSSYVQEFLVSIYVTATELYNMETAKQDITSTVSMESMKLFNRLVAFQHRLDTSLVRGNIYYGTFKIRALKHHIISTFFLYIETLLWFAFGKVFGPDRSESVIKPVGVETWQIAEDMKRLQTHLPFDRRISLSREIVDFTSLYHATMESYASNFVIFSGYLSFCTGVTFFIGNVSVRATSAAWAMGFFMAGGISFGAITPITSISAGWYLFRLSRLLWNCSTALVQKKSMAKNDVAKENLGQVHFIVRLMWFAMTTRMFAALLAAAALPLNLYASLTVRNRAPALAIAIIAICIQVAMNGFLFLVEYRWLYRLTPKLGEYIGIAFEDEITALKADLTVPFNDFQSDQMQERTSWEYVARAFLYKYRFDTAFGANRFGCIMQYIQSGLQYRPDSSASRMKKNYTIISDHYEDNDKE